MSSTKQAKSQQWQETKTPPVTEWRKKPWENPAESFKKTSWECFYHSL